MTMRALPSGRPALEFYQNLASGRAILLQTFDDHTITIEIDNTSITLPPSITHDEMDRFCSLLRWIDNERER